MYKVIFNRPVKLYSSKEQKDVIYHKKGKNGQMLTHEILKADVKGNKFFEALVSKNDAVISGEFKAPKPSKAAKVVKDDAIEIAEASKKAEG